jgi:hypothetical protein
VRVWFARLQVPVLRVALAEPEFFSNMEHPARSSLTAWASCWVLIHAINGQCAGGGNRRIVQVIEQYPKPGGGFRLFDEFEKFLVPDQAGHGALVSVAQQVEQKRRWPSSTPSSCAPCSRTCRCATKFVISFKTWAEVLAMSAVRDGAQHADTVASSARQPTWSGRPAPSPIARPGASDPKPARAAAAFAPGADLMGMTGQVQDAQIKALTDTLAEAFLSKTAAIPLEHIRGHGQAPGQPGRLHRRCRHGRHAAGCRASR